MTLPTPPVPPPLPLLTVDDLAEFKGKETMFFGFFAPTAIEMAAFLVSEITGIQYLSPDDVRGNKLYKFATMELAYQLYVEQEYADISINPFSGETIGSYSYNKSQVARSALSGESANNIWLKLLTDYAQNNLNEGSTDISFGGIIGTEYDGVAVDSTGAIHRVLGPKNDPLYFDGIYGNEDHRRGPRF